MFWIYPGFIITWVRLLVSSPKCFCYCVYFDICPSTTQSVCFDTCSIVIVLTSGPVDWINTSVSCLVKLPLWCCNYPNNCVITTLSIHYDIYFTTIVLTGGQTWSWPAVIVAWLADTQKDDGQQGSLYLACQWFICSICWESQRGLGLCLVTTTKGEVAQLFTYATKHMWQSCVTSTYPVQICDPCL